MCVFRYNISLKDYYCFRFFELPDNERNNWAGSGYMYEYQIIMNPKKKREVLEDKIRFLNHFKPFVKRKFFTLDELRSNLNLVEEILDTTTDGLVVKNSHGQVGAEVEIISTKDYSPAAFIQYLEKKGFNLIEEYVVQHSSIMKVSSSGLNTVRVFTQLHDGKVHFLGARLRLTVNSPVDNMAAGNLAAPIDDKTGIINGPAVFSDITKEDQSVHPVSGKAITGFAIPHWQMVLELAEKASLNAGGNRSVGWDIAVTQNGVDLSEGNHNWCRLLWQMPVKQGLKNELEKYI